MRPNSKSATAIAILWSVSLVGAFWLGGGSDRQAAADANNAESNGSGRNGLRSVTTAEPSATGGEGARSLSPSSSNAGGNAADKILRLLGGASGADLRRSEFRDLTENMALDEVLQAVGQLATMAPSPAQRDAYTEVLSRWAQLDATAALEHVASIDAPKFRQEATINVLRHWAAVDPAAAVAFADSDPNNNLPNGSLSAVFRGIGNSMDTTAALGFLASIEDEQHQRYAFDAVRELFERNDTEVIEWTQSLPEGEVRDRSVLALVDQWARYDPLAARTWLMENTTESNRDGAMVKLGESWARSDPEAAAAWALGLDDGNGGSKVTDRVFRRWMEYDFASAAGYLVEQEPSPELDGALEQYIQRIRKVDPDATMAWAESISDPKRRRNAVLQVAKIWRGQDPQAYASYIESSPVLSEADRDKLLGRDKTKPKAKKPKPPKQKKK